MAQKEKQAAAEQTFVFLAPLARKPSAEQMKERRSRWLSSGNLQKQAAAEQMKERRSQKTAKPQQEKI